MQQYLISILIFTPLVATVIGLFLPATSKLFRLLTLVVNGIQIGILIPILTHFTPGAGLQCVEQKPWITLHLGSFGTLQAEYFVGIDGLSLPLVCLSVFVMGIVTISSWTIEKNQKGFFILLLILNASIIGSFTALDFLLFYLFFEFMLLPMFFLIAIWGGDRREYASIKFFLYTLAGSILILIVLIALYISVHNPGAPGQLTHSFNLLHMAEPGNYFSNSILDANNTVQLGWFTAREWAFLFLLIGFAIKLPVVPFHTWLPDAHVEAPTPVSVVLAPLLLKIGGYGLARIAFPIFPEAAMEFSWLMAFIGVLSIIYGGLNAMASKDLKRLIAYSSVSHMGFVLLGLASLTPEGIAGSVYQMFSHGIISAMLFLLAGVLYDRTHDRTINHYSGLSLKMPVYTAMILVGFFASMGLPGFAGFIGEILVFLGAFKAKSANGLLHEGFAIVATLGLVVTAAYYLWAIQRMFFGPLNIKGGHTLEQLYDLKTREYFLLLPLALAALVFGIFPQIMLNMINPFAETFSEWVIKTGKTLTINP
jgi:NADH-quinone oxidoreductase subunit M